MTIGILGGGVWGSALARVLSKNKVIIYARDKNIVPLTIMLQPQMKFTTYKM